MKKLVTLIVIVFAASLANADLKIITDGTEYTGDKSHPTGTYYFGRAQDNDEDLESRKANRADTYTKAETDTSLGTKANAADLSTITAGTDPTKAAVAEVADSAIAVSGAFVDGSSKVGFGNNTAISPTIGLYEIYVEGDTFKTNVNGVETDFAAGGGTSLPDQAGQAGKYLTSDGTDASWTDIPDPVSIIDDAAISGNTVTYSVDKIIALIQEQMGFPQLSVLTPAFDGAWVQVAGYTSLAGTSSDAGSVVSVQWKIPSTSFVNATGTTSWTVPLITFPDQGPNTITVEVTDDQGNKTQTVRTINLDSIAPVVALGADTTHDGTGNFTVTADMVTESNLDTVTVDGTERTLPYDVELSGASDITVDIVITDIAGNTGNDSITLSYTIPVSTLGDETLHVGESSLINSSAYAYKLPAMTENGTLSSISVALGGAGALTKDVTFALYSSAVGDAAPDELIAMSDQVTTAVETTPVFLTADVPSTPSLTTGTQYWVVIQAPASYAYIGRGDYDGAGSTTWATKTVTPYDWSAWGTSASSSDHYPFSVYITYE